MENNCINCKYFYNGICRNKNLEIDIVNNNDGISYIEDGILNETLKENLDFKDMVETVIATLHDNDIIKKSFQKDWNKIHNIIDNDYIENSLIEIIDESISSSIMNYFKLNNQEQEKKINNPYEFSCCYWE